MAITCIHHLTDKDSRELKADLEKIDELGFIFTSPTFVANEDADNIRKERKELHILKLDREQSLYGSEFEIQVLERMMRRTWPASWGEQIAILRTV